MAIPGKGINQIVEEHFLTKERYNISSRFLKDNDILLLNEYQKALIDFMLYEKISNYEREKIFKEIKTVEIFIKRVSIQYLQ